MVEAALDPHRWGRNAVALWCSHSTHLADRLVQVGAGPNGLDACRRPLALTSEACSRSVRPVSKIGTRRERAGKVGRSEALQVWSGDHCASGSGARFVLASELYFATA